MNYLVDRKINDLSYGGMRKIEEYTKDRLGTEFVEDIKTRKLLVIFMELRRIDVHNRGYVNDVFLHRIVDDCGFKFEKNKRYHVDFEGIHYIGKQLCPSGGAIGRGGIYQISSEAKAICQLEKETPTLCLMVNCRRQPR